MQLIQTISMDFAVHGVAPRVFGKQDDSLSRLVRISLSSNGVAWTIPSDAIFMLRYRTPSGGVGLYDTLPNGSSAFSVAGNQITVVLVDQIFAAAGVAECDLRIISDGAGASTWTFLVDVDRGPTGDNIVSSDYINVLTALASQVAADAKRAENAANSIDTTNLMNKILYDPTDSVAAAGGIPNFVANNAPKVTLSSSVTSTSTTTAANSYAVKKAYDQAESLLTSQKGAAFGVAPLNASSQIDNSYLYTSQISMKNAANVSCSAGTVTFASLVGAQKGPIVSLSVHIVFTTSSTPSLFRFSVSGIPECLYGIGVISHGISADADYALGNSADGFIVTTANDETYFEITHDGGIPIGASASFLCVLMYMAK